MKYVIVLLFILTSCTTVEFVRKDVTPQKQGVLRHSITSDEKKAAEYRAEVNKKAREFCGTDFTITKEYQAREEARSTAGIGTGFSIGRSSSLFIGGMGPSSSMYDFVEFMCK